jgi:zinc transport system substrate-binding protein
MFTFLKSSKDTRNKIIFGTVIIIFAVAVAVFIRSTSVQKTTAHHDKLIVVTTLFPLYDMAKNIGGDKADVSLLLPPGAEAHTFEPKPSDIVKINEADIFIYTGMFMEPWAADIIKSVKNKKLIVVDASQGVKMIPAVFHDEDEPVGSMDPHIWLDFDNAKVMVGSIKQAFIKKDNLNSDFYSQNALAYNTQLITLDNEYKAALSRCQTKEIIYAGHYAFGYLAHRYGLKYLAAQGVSPDSEPTAKDLIQLINQINKDKVKYVFYEELTSPKIAETIAQETHAKILMLNAAHNLSKKQFESGVTFFEIFKSNLNNLKVGFECKE